jgi:hypothetical protein
MLTIHSALAGLFRRKIILLAGLIGASYLFSSQTASALPPSPGKIPNGAKYDCLSCHVAGSYAADTQMKLDFLHTSPTKTWTIALAQADSEHLIGDTAVVAVTVVLKGDYLGQALDGKFRYIRVWKLAEGTWKVIAGSVVPLSPGS